MTPLRLIDANANRGREAMRVMEDAARFLLDDAALSADLKQARHDLAAALTPLGELSLHRDTPGDVGTTHTTSQETIRGGVAEVALAAGKRLSEALRAIEEYGKLPALVPGVAGGSTVPRDIKSLRNRCYDLEARLNRMIASIHRQCPQWRLCVLLSERLCPGGDWQRVARAAVAGGADCLQLREKDVESGELLDRARWLVELAGPARASVIVNDRPDIALLAGADGVHLGQSDLPAAQVRTLVGNRLLIGVSTSRLDEAIEAMQGGADYCGVGPMFPTTTKHKPILAGPEYLRNFLHWNRLPHLAIGGIGLTNITALLDAGARGIAVSSLICGSDDPEAVTREVVQRLDAAGNPS